MAKNIPCKFSDLNDDITKPHGGYVNLDAWDKIKDKELEYIKKIYLEEPDDYLHYTKFEYVVDIHRSGKKPYMDCNNQKCKVDSWGSFEHARFIIATFSCFRYFDTKLKKIVKNH